MFYAITKHLTIERDALIGMTAVEVKEMALDAGDLITEKKAQVIIDLAKADKENEAAEAANPKRKHKHTN